MNIDGVPASIPQQRVTDFLNSLSLDPMQLLSFRMDRNAVHAEVFALNEKGQRYCADGANAATHTIVIPIVDN